jgi:hypothetical protein
MKETHSYDRNEGQVGKSGSELSQTLSLTFVLYLYNSQFTNDISIAPSFHVVYENPIR